MPCNLVVSYIIHRPRQGAKPHLHKKQVQKFWVSLVFYLFGLCRVDIDNHLQDLLETYKLNFVAWLRY